MKRGSKKAIITTTINPPTKALKKFAMIAKSDDWHLFIVGDKKTPHDAHREFQELHSEHVTYITPEDQEKISKKLSDLIGWNCIQRRNFGLIAAYQWGAEVIATIDDDNVPTERWGKRVVVGEELGISEFKTEQIVWDPMIPAFPTLWHRGFPIELIHKRIKTMPQQRRRKVLVQADLWDGDPDIDAICRISQRPNVAFNPNIMHFAGSAPSPFNSQNTFLSREVIPEYFLFPHIGRMDDIWASYWVQKKFPRSVAYYKATVVQERNEHNLFKDLQAELLGYEHTLNLVEWMYNDDSEDWPEFMPEKSLEAFKVYQELINAG